MFITTDPVVWGRVVPLPLPTAVDRLLEASDCALRKLEPLSTDASDLAGELVALCQGLAALVNVLERPAGVSCRASTCVDLFLAALCCDRICEAASGQNPLVGCCSRRVGLAARSAAEALAAQLRQELS